MRREAAKKHIKEIIAFAEGKDLETECITGVWEDCPNPTFAEGVKYRVKAPKIGTWAVVGTEQELYFYKTKMEAEQVLAPGERVLYLTESEEQPK